MKVDSLIESPDFVQHLTFNLIKIPSFTVCITDLVKQDLQVAVVDEAKLYDETMAALTKMNNLLQRRQ